MQTHNKVSILCVLCILNNTCLLCHTFSLLQDIHLILKKPHNLHQTSLLILRYWHNFFFLWENDICLSIFIHLSCNLCLVKMLIFHTTMLAYLINHKRGYQLFNSLRSNEWNSYIDLQCLSSMYWPLETVSQYMMTWKSFTQFLIIWLRTQYISTKSYISDIFISNSLIDWLFGILCHINSISNI